MRLYKSLATFVENLRAELAREGPSFAQVRQKIAAGRHAVLPALEEISRISTSIDRSHQTIREFAIKTERGDQVIPVGHWTLAFVAKELIYVGHDDFDQPISSGHIAFYSNWYTNIIDPRSLLTLFSSAKRRRRAQSVVIRIDYEQLALQRLSPIAEIARALILYQPQSTGHRASTYNPTTEFLSLSGLSIMDFITAGFAAFTRAKQSSAPRFLARNLTPAGISAGPLSPNIVGKFLARTSADFAVTRQFIEEEESQLRGFEKYALNPLFKTPIVETGSFDTEGDPILVAPIPPLILYRVSHGIYWDLLDKWSGDVASRGRKNVDDFPSFFGGSFQQYVGDLLGEFIPTNRLLPERRFGTRSRAQDSCDWIVIEGGTAILIECKTSRFHKATKATGDPRQFLEEATDIYAKALVQLLRTKRAIEAGELSLPSKPSRFLGVVVIFDHILMAAMHLGDDLRRIVPTIETAFSSDDIDALDFRIIPIRLLETFATSIPTEGLAGVFDSATWENITLRGGGGHALPNILKTKFHEFERSMESALQI